METEHPALAVIGGGSMASAILLGAAEAGVVDLERVVVADPNPERRRLFTRTSESAGAALAQLAGEPDAQVLLAVKPQMLAGVGGEIGPELAGRPRAVISILAGVESGRVRAKLGGSCPVVRVMPNTPARVRLGMSCLALGAGAEEADAAFALRLFGAIGEVVRVDESLVDAFTALAGSGPAYAFLLAEAMAGAGRELGLDPGDADRAARQTLLGAATLLSSSDRSAAELRDAVTSRKGTTAAALDVFEAGGFRELVERAMTAARDRGRELSADA